MFLIVSVEVFASIFFALSTVSVDNQMFLILICGLVQYWGKMYELLKMNRREVEGTTILS